MAETYWKAQENRVRKLFENRGWLKARRNPHSGALPMETLKGDVCAEFPTNHMAVRIDHKSTRGQESITIGRRELTKIAHEAITQQEYGFVTFGFLGSPRLYAALPLLDLMYLLEEASPEIVGKLTGYRDEAPAV